MKMMIFLFDRWPDLRRWLVMQDYKEYGLLPWESWDQFTDAERVLVDAAQRRQR